MINRVCRCVEIPITDEEKVYIHCNVVIEEKIQRMFPNGKMIRMVPDISIEFINGEYVFESVYKDVGGVEKNLYDIMFVIEELIQKKYSYLVLHGGAIAKENEAIAFIQARKAGKSTLIRGVLSNKQYSYVSDDLLLMSENKIAGVGLPIRVRDKLEGVISSEGTYIDRYVDEAGEIRNIYVPNSIYSIGFKKVSAMVIPFYGAEFDNSIRLINGIEKIIRVINNVKEYRSVSFLYDELIRICNGISIYEIRYSNIEFVQQVLSGLWRDG